VQIVSAAASNAYLPGFLSGTIYRGSLKGTCVPFLNCYSCPGAVGACPVGSLQSIAAGQKLPLYVLGGTVAAGSLAGRFACGWLCPFGLIQELLFRLSRIRAAIPAALLKLRYAVLALLLPLAAFWTGPSGVGAPYFCKYICPAGTLEAGLPLLALNSDLRPLVGPVFLWKVAVLAVVIGACLVAYRPFCRTLCPLGALYGLLNPVSIWRIEVDAARCDRCGTCAKVCPVGLNPAEQPNSRECLRCLRCTRACPAGALTFAAGDRKVPAGERGRTHDGLADSAT
jgi:polyferredoxin